MMKTVLITGADRGIGYSLCECFIEGGWYVIAGQYMPEWPQLSALAEKYPEEMKIKPSVSNFFFVRFKDSKKICDALKDQYSIAVRDFPTAPIPHTRITVGTSEENQALVEALTEILAEQK